MSFDLISLILQAGLIVKLVLLLLLIISLVSLTIIVVKWRELRAADQDSEAFLEVYRREGFSETFDAARHLDRSPLAVVFLITGGELQAARERDGADRTRERLVIQLARSIAWSSAAQVRRLERGMPFLATISCVRSSSGRPPIPEPMNTPIRSAFAGSIFSSASRIASSLAAMA